jgi:hypothetical protein
MQSNEYGVLLSASDLMRFAGCARVTDVPRGMGFHFSPGRINVAVSRARALALFFASPRLLDARCATVEQVRLVDTLCVLPAADAPPALGDAA